MLTEVTEDIMPEYQGVIDHFKRKHIRITESRRAIVIYMIKAHHHPSAEQIYRDLNPQFPSLSLATIYNNLRMLVDEGFVSEIKVTNDNTTYFDFMGHDHVNVVCEVCGRISDLAIELPDIAQEASQQTGYRVTKSQFTIYGICEDCQRKNETEVY
ncbi:Fur family transcriptional regulator [Streptococcus pluranimalium]|uniref:Fur family transcriptional regulator n=1 Tax=Streptococcus acidominimus TaxID=1326 RepID=A0A239XDI1_STRAI|nr:MULTISPECIES: Fur family transcriptional regulator [Streptococcus]MDY3024793.1 Fur family transcriptional regulator [Streptococcus hyovaginalis]MDY4510812.1 Fur family transcriptional regulator [Streptococcus hyovaginalis]MDY5973347.1 Fur family transcriptional regulator [Streptococcus hyovaginalis]SNV44044.1 fur family transcriptional regulator [Streptococcus acidominimus]